MPLPPVVVSKMNDWNGLLFPPFAPVSNDPLNFKALSRGMLLYVLSHYLLCGPLDCLAPLL